MPAAAPATGSGSCTRPGTDPSAAGTYARTYKAAIANTIPGTHAVSIAFAVTQPVASTRQRRQPRRETGPCANTTAHSVSTGRAGIRCR